MWSWRGAAGGGRSGAHRHWLLVAALLAINTYAFVDRAVLALLVEPIRLALHATDVQLGLLLGLGFALFYALCAFPAGYAVDRLSRRGIIAAGSLLWAAMTVVCGTAAAMPQLFVGRAGVGIAESVIAPAAFSLIRDAVPPRARGLAFSLYAMAPLIGSALSLLIGGRMLGLASAGAFGRVPWLGRLAPWQCTLILTGLAGLPLSLLLLPAREPARPAAAADAVPTLLGGLAAAWAHMWHRRRLYAPLVLYVTFGAMANFANSAWVPALLGRVWHLAPQRVGPLMGGMVLSCGIVGLVVSGLALNALTARGRDVRTYGLIATVGSTVGMVGIGLAPSLPVALAMVGLSSFFLGTSYAVGATTLAQITPVALMGRVTAIYFLFQSLLGQALGPFLVALGAQHLGGAAPLAASFALCTGLFGVAMIAAIVVLRTRLRTGAAAIA